MRQKDIAVIVAVVICSAILSVVASKLLFSKPQNRQIEVEVVHPISADFPEPDKRYFNANSLDPTQAIQIGNSNNPDPFRGPAQ
jgi:hypothetical protein